MFSRSKLQWSGKVQTQRNEKETKRWTNKESRRKDASRRGARPPRFTRFSKRSGYTEHLAVKVTPTSCSLAPHTEVLTASRSGLCRVLMGAVIVEKGASGKVTGQVFDSFPNHAWELPTILNITPTTLWDSPINSRTKGSSRTCPPWPRSEIQVNPCGNYSNPVWQLTAIGWGEPQ